MTIFEDIKKLESERSEIDKDLENIRNLLEVYPDLKIHINRWKKKRFYSSSVNSQATDYERYYSCGCCPDAALQISPYIDTLHGRIYSDPVVFTVGEMYGYNDKPSEGWDLELRSKSIPEHLIDKLASFFEDQKIMIDED